MYFKYPSLGEGVLYTGEFELDYELALSAIRIASFGIQPKSSSGLIAYRTWGRAGETSPIKPVLIILDQRRRKAWGVIETPCLTMSEEVVK